MICVFVRSLHTSEEFAAVKVSVRGEQVDLFDRTERVLCAALLQPKMSVSVPVNAQCVRCYCLFRTGI